MATVYLLHFNKPIGNPLNRRAMAQHYIGHSPDADKRLAAHEAGNGAKIVAAVQRRGIGFVVARTWITETVAEAWTLEHKLKRRKKARQFCPICRGEET